jgi:hypothetical protein
VTELVFSIASFAVSTVVLPIVRYFWKSYADRIEKLESRQEHFTSELARLSSAQSVSEANYQNILREMQDVKRLIERLLDKIERSTTP